MSESGAEEDGYESANSGRASVGSQATPAMKEDYLWLDEDHCRVFMETKVGGTTVPVVCARLSANCGYASHQRDRTSGDVGEVGAYLRINPPRSRRVYGARDVDPLTRVEYDALGDVDGVDLNAAAEELNRNGSEAPVNGIPEGDAGDAANGAADPEDVPPQDWIDNND